MSTNKLILITGIGMFVVVALLGIVLLSKKPVLQNNNSESIDNNAYYTYDSNTDIEKTYTDANELPKQNIQQTQSIDTKIVKFGNGYQITIPSNWNETYPKYEDQSNVIDIFDDQGNHVMSIRDKNIGRGFENASSVKKFNFNTNLGELNGISVVTNENTGDGMIVYGYGFYDKGFEIDVYFGPTHYRIGEGFDGAGYKERFANKAEVEADTELNNALRSLSLIK